MNRRHDIIQVLAMSLLLMACATGKQMQPATERQDAMRTLLEDSTLQYAHVGVMIADAETQKVIAAHNEHKYFVPASNTKLWTMYAGLKYLGDSLIAGYLANANDSVVHFRSHADPTFLHPDYKYQPLANVLQQYKQVNWYNASMVTTAYGNGWSWNDYDATYMAPRSSMPMFGNVASFTLQANGYVKSNPANVAGLVTNINTFRDTGFSIQRLFDQSFFTLQSGKTKRANSTLYMTPLSTVQLAATHFGNDWYFEHTSVPENLRWQKIYSQPTDSLLKPLMHRSDNFFAEQTLLMISQQWFGYMNEGDVIDSLLQTDLQAMPDKPRWVDGSGLSRYNLFTPADFIWLLQQCRSEFSMARLQNILPTGNDGTLTNYYKPLEGKLFAKTGTLAGVVALSGYMTSKQGRLLLLSVQVNNHNGSAASVRRAVEKYLLHVWEHN
ncbi:MAG: D-alanyl-D-alanine carboxypeptidase [Chitinophagaceae bacterium]|nr:D-alanyl-D-alanine carboxypeptidase [Chitinophagaceae bacterium]